MALYGVTEILTSATNRQRLKSKAIPVANSGAEVGGTTTNSATSDCQFVEASAKANGWGNADLLPDVKINTDAMARTIQLVQQGFVKITEWAR